MKKLKIFVAILLTSSILTTQTGCFGSFGLTMKVYDFNKEMGDQWVQELVFLAFGCIQVYTIAFFIDAFVLNSIEFWTGTNPVAMNDSDMEQKIVKSGEKIYQITATKNKYNIKQTVGPEVGKELDIIYNPETSTWTANNGTESIDLVNFNKRTGIVKFLKGNQEMVFDANVQSIDYMRNSLQANVAMN
ncbi:MAG TPA: hypothetical protein DDX39_06155 [Bacteroidales bacterium]|nr:MAG: hypothetical protein A2W98_00670 [Bacteroidetes bacterium GWF2_33_38]OFY75948.1 MAG: hypothetical protein A2265_09695 [Bacteroidetes bacterium RIFOXYA12_FULL_33_9]OFY86258.1 MAG: hypothetical protein A2236_12865 [Bacteroidetes bacterium RIFOXYA2_FULL_33_7]HBF88209.1 hypothetical protein [Bacteroidales bacterium]